MRRLIPVMLTMVSLLGCGGRGEEQRAFDKVEIERLTPAGRRDKAIVLTDRESVARVADFLPGVGRGKKSDTAGGWRPGYRLKFIPAEGAAVQILVRPDGKVWSEGQGNGDWRAKDGLKDHLDHLLDRKPDERSDAGWSDPVGGLRGRLVLRYRPRSNGREILDVHVELKNVSGDVLALRNDPASVRLTVNGPDGTAIRSTLPVARSGPVAPPQWGVLPRGAYLGFSLYDYGVGIPPGPGAHLAVLPPMQC